MTGTWLKGPREHEGERGSANGLTSEQGCRQGCKGLRGGFQGLGESHLLHCSVNNRSWVHTGLGSEDVRKGGVHVVT